MGRVVVESVIENVLDAIGILRCGALVVREMPMLLRDIV
jgi:hypothetical protein